MLKVCQQRLGPGYPGGAGDFQRSTQRDRSRTLQDEEGIVSAICMTNSAGRPNALGMDRAIHGK